MTEPQMPEGPPESGPPPEAPNTPELTMEAVIDMRERIVRGEPVSDEELRSSINWLRQDRMLAATKKPKKKSTKVVMSNDALAALLNKPIGGTDGAGEAS